MSFNCTKRSSAWRYAQHWASRVVLVGKNAGDMRDSSSIPGSEDPLEEEWQPTPVLQPGQTHGQRGESPYSHKESDTTERTQHTHTRTPSTNVGDSGVLVFLWGFLKAYTKFTTQESLLLDKCEQTRYHLGVSSYLRLRNIPGVRTYQCFP